MKKLVFTAIAVIAFSGVSMAETTEVKIVENYGMIVAESGDCETFAMDFIDEYDSNHPGAEMEISYAQVVYQQLLDVCYNEMR